METWRRVWRVGFAPGLSTPGLRALRDGLAIDDPAIAQGASVSPAEGEVASTCAVGYCAWRGDDCRMAAEVEAHFIRACLAADTRLGCAGASRWFLNWFDDGPRDVVFRCLLAEVDLVLARRLSRDWPVAMLKAA